MPETEKGTRTCHECGLEDIEACQEHKGHRSSMLTDEPCKYCIWNLESDKHCWIDFYSEGWTCECSADRGSTVDIEDPDQQDQNLLIILHSIREAKERKQIKIERGVRTRQAQEMLTR